jgi:hypothetical protein
MHHWLDSPNGQIGSHGRALFVLANKHDDLASRFALGQTCGMDNHGAIGQVLGQQECGFLMLVGEGVIQ